jgi:hypothetical protein
MYQLRYTAKYLENELPYNKLSYIKFILWRLGGLRVITKTGSWSDDWIY